MPVSERSSPRRRGTRSCTAAPAGPPPAGRRIGMCTWPSSPAIPAAPLTTWPDSIDAAAEPGADDRRHRGPLRRVRAEVTWWAYSAAALPSLL